MLNRAVDNDIILKAVTYGLSREYWGGERIAVLGAARYVVAGRLKREPPGEPNRASAELAALLALCDELEPNDEEVELASQLETASARAGLALDAGESQLAAISVFRAMAVLETGDKRAIESLEKLLGHVSELTALSGKVCCLEQIVRRLVEAPGDYERLSAAICAEPQADKALAICFSCSVAQPADRATAIAGLESYIGSVRDKAPTLLAQTST
jgi:hypothetical protein